MKRIAAIAGCILLLILCLPAQAQVNLESRVIRLESELFAIQSQLSQLSANRTTPGVSVAASVPARTSRTTLLPAAQFDRLATLVIELKERVNKLEAQVQKLERR